MHGIKESQIVWGLILIFLEIFAFSAFELSAMNRYRITNVCVSDLWVL